MSIHFIGCTHFHHPNIIRYCDRPFSSVREMDTALVKNWNRVVRERDIVFHLGDFAFGKRPLSWLNLLNGRVIFIKGSHDRTGMPFFVLHFHFLTNAFLLIHDPKDAPKDWTGWVIHAHLHNNDMANYPFINRDKRRINVSAELINYTPIGLGAIERIIKAQEEAIKG